MSAESDPATTTVDRSAWPAKPRTSWRLWAGLGVFVAITGWAAYGIEFTLAPLVTNLTRGADVLAQFLRPDWGFLVSVWPAWVETLYIAVIAGVIGNGLALAISFPASKVTSPNRVVYQFAKLVLSVIRSLPDVAYGLLFVAAVGSGALGGILALVLFNLGVNAKLTSETIDAIDAGPLEAADAAGANRMQRARAAVLPQILPNYVSYSLYVFEINIRASVVIGIVGGGGIGNVISVQLSRFDYENISGIVVALFVIVFALDRVSIALRRRLV